MGRPKGSKNSILLEKTTEETSKNVLEQNNNSLNTSEDFFIPRIYARSQVQPLWATTPRNSSAKKYTSEQINKALINPYITYKELQNISNYLLYNSAMYNNFLDYLSNLITWDYVLLCEDVDKVNKSTIEKRYYESARTIYKINIKTVFPALLKRVLANGECYFYNMSDGNNNIIVEIDSAICQLAQIDDNNIWRYYVNVSLIEPLRIYEFPVEIQDYYRKWIDGGKLKTKKNIDGIDIPDYLFPVSNNGFAMFCHIRKTQHDYPYLASLFEDLNNLETDKDYMGDYIKESNTKLVHMKVPTDKTSGKPLMDKDVIEIYHNSAKEHLPRNVAPLTNPFEVEAISLDKAQSSTINLVEYSTKVVMQDSGISESMFNASTTLGLEYSTLADSSKLYPLIYYFQNFLNLQIKQYKTKATILKINHHNQLDWHERYYADVQAGGSRSLFVCTSGIEPYDVINLAKTEDILDFDSLLKPKLNSSQMNSTDLNKQNGAPEKTAKEGSDSTNKEKEYR